MEAPPRGRAGEMSEPTQNKMSNDQMLDAAQRVRDWMIETFPDLPGQDACVIISHVMGAIIEGAAAPGRKFVVWEVCKALVDDYLAAPAEDDTPEVGNVATSH